MLTDFFNRIIDKGGRSVLSEKQLFERLIMEFKASPERRMMFDGTRYYSGDHDILFKDRTAIGDDGELVKIDNVPNNHVVDNCYRKLVMQKSNYLCGRPITIQGENGAYVQALQDALFTKGFLRKMKNICTVSMNEGVCYLYVNYGDDGKLCLKTIPAHEFIPGWADAEHTALDYGIRIYPVLEYNAEEREVVEYVEIYKDTGIDFYRIYGNSLKPCEPYHQDYFTDGEITLNWSKIPIVAFKYSDDEQPLIKNTKSLQDGINSILTNFENGMEEDVRNTILVLVNYDGQDLGQFRKNLAAYGAVKVRSCDGVQGDVKTLQVEVNAENYKAILEIFKKSLIECGMGYDAKDDRIGSNANQLNIRSMYSDIDLDANSMETEYQASFEHLLWFVNCYLFNTGRGNFDGETVDIIFNRDMLINEGEVIDNITKSRDLLSDETLIAQHPWVNDPEAELERVREQKEKNMEQYNFGQFGTGDEKESDEEDTEDEEEP